MPPSTTHVELDGGDTGVDTGDDLLGNTDGVDVVLVEAVRQFGEARCYLLTCELDASKH